MFKVVKIITAISLTLTLGQATLSLAQDLPSENFEGELTPLISASCALFVWIDGSETPRLVSSESDTFGFNAQNERTDFKVIYRSDIDDFGQYARQDLDDGSRRLYQLHLGPPKDHGDMILYQAGTWTQPNEDGWLQIETAKAVSSCNLSEGQLDSLFNEENNLIRTPQGVTHPDKIHIEPLAKEAEAIAPPPVIKSAPPIIIENVETLAEVATTPIISPPIIEEITPPSPYAVQIGSFRKEDRVLIHLASVRDAAPYIDQYQTEIQTVELDEKAPFYRLRLTALSDRPMAIKLCQRLKTDGIDCFVP